MEWLQCCIAGVFVHRVGPPPSLTGSFRASVRYQETKPATRPRTCDRWVASVVALLSSAVDQGKYFEGP